MKKILVIHTKYKNIGGEDVAVKSEINLLKKYYEVEVLYLQNNYKNILSLIFSFLFNSNLNSNKELKKVIKVFKPDFAYIHNTWFKASLGIFKILEKNNIHIILKLHNFRYFCTNTYFTKKHLNNNYCQACGMNEIKSGFLNKYFRESLLKSIFMIRFGKKYYKILKTQNLKIIVLTQFHINFLENLAFDQSKIYKSLNFIDLYDRETLTEVGNNSIVYAGRISNEKGVENLIESFLKSNLNTFTLKIIGDGPDFNFLSEKYKSSPKKIIFYGQKTNKEVLNEIQKSKAVVTATRLYEGQPTLLCEASSLGIPSIFPNTGGINEFFPPDYSLKFEQFNYSDLIQKLNLLDDIQLITDIGQQNKKYLINLLNEKDMIENFERILNE
tara:strand:+ start:1031 stop:2185 length:1155 start_codon:yes stop_codon:yes gene_type:complete